MKTKIRTQESSGGLNTFGRESVYGHMTIQILAHRYSGARYLEPMGEITFQRNLNEPDKSWYAMNFVINTSNYDHIKGMAKIAKLILNQRSGYSAQPEEIIQLIGGVEHVNFDSEFIPVSDKGKNIYRVIREGSLYDKITAKTEKIAQNILDKKKILGAKLEFDKVISF